MLDLKLTPSLVTPVPTDTVVAGGDTNLTFQLAQQYVLSNSLGQIKSLTVDSKGWGAYILSQNTPSLFSLVAINMAIPPPGVCV